MLGKGERRGRGRGPSATGYLGLPAETTVRQRQRSGMRPGVPGRRVVLAMGLQPTSSLACALLGLASLASGPLAVAPPTIGTGAGREPVDETTERLAALRSASADERAAAERWLAAHLTPADYPVLASAAQDGDAEVRRRLMRVLSQADLDLALSARLLQSGETRLASLAEEALRRAIARWNPALARPGRRADELRSGLETRAETTWPQPWRIPLASGLETAVGYLEREGDLPVGVTVELGLSGRRSATDELRGTWLELIMDLGRTFEVGCELFGFDDEREGLPGFVRYFDELAERDARRSGIDVLFAWLAVFLEDASGTSVDAPDRARRARAARNLASSGWPSALALLGDRYREANDEAALEGLAVAATAGRVGDALLDDALLERVFLQTEADLAADSEPRRARARRLRLALQEVGPITGAGGRSAGIVLRGFEEAAPESVWLRLRLLESWRAIEGETVARAVLADGERPSGLRRQALSTLAAIGSVASGELAAPQIPDPAALARGLGSLAEAAELASLLRRLDVTPPPDWNLGAGSETGGVSDPLRLPAALAQASFVARAFALHWYLERDEIETAAAHLLLLHRDVPPASAAGVDWESSPSPARSDRSVGVLAPAVERGARLTLGAVLRRARQRARDEAEGLELERAAWLSGLVRPERALEIFERWAVARGAVAGEAAVADGTLEPRLLGALAGAGDYEACLRARDALTTALVSALGTDPGVVPVELEEAIRRGFHGLYASGLDGSAGLWAQEIDGFLRRQRRSDRLREVFDPWPPIPLGPPGLGAEGGGVGDRGAGRAGSGTGARDLAADERRSRTLDF